MPEIQKSIADGSRELCVEPVSKCCGDLDTNIPTALHLGHPALGATAGSECASVIKQLRIES
jgi:hypothetical protein